MMNPNVRIVKLEKKKKNKKKRKKKLFCTFVLELFRLVDVGLQRFCRSEQMAFM